MSMDKKLTSAVYAAVEKAYDHRCDIEDAADEILEIIKADRKRRGEPTAAEISDVIREITGCPDIKNGEDSLVVALGMLFHRGATTQPTEPVNKTDWSAELSSWSDEDFIQIFHERPDLAKRLRKMLAEPVKVPSEAKEALWKAYESLRELEKRIVLDANQISGAAAASFAANRVLALLARYGKGAP